MPHQLQLVSTKLTYIGIFIGIGIHSVYNENQAANLYVSGIFNALAAGILLYSSLVTLITPEVTDSAEFRAKGIGEKVLNFLGLYLGAGVMALIAVWA